MDNQISPIDAYAIANSPYMDQLMGIAIEEKADDLSVSSLAYSYNTLAMVLHALRDFPAEKILLERAITLDEKYGNVPLLVNFR